MVQKRRHFLIEFEAAIDLIAVELVLPKGLKAAQRFFLSLLMLFFFLGLPFLHRLSLSLVYLNDKNSSIKLRVVLIASVHT